MESLIYYKSFEDVDKDFDGQEMTCFRSLKKIL